MKLRQIMLLLMIAAIVTLIGGFTHADQQTKWLKKAKLGPYAAETQDWKAIEAAARKEGKVVIYSVSSRIFKLQDAFKKKYGITIEAHDIWSEVQLEKLRREHKAGIYQVDVLYNADASLILNEILPRKMVWNFVPDSVAGFLDESEKTPLLVQRWSSRPLFYNATRNPGGSPIDNLWDLTREEWKGRVLMSDPLQLSVMANAIQTILQHPDEMAAAYKEEFGESVSFSPALVEATKENPILGEPDAAREWLYRLLHNKPVLLASTTKIFKNIADVESAAPPVGITPFSKLRVNKKGVFNAQPIYNLKPAMGSTYPIVLAIANRAPHPNAAKLLVRYLVEEGFEPWNVPGDYSSRSDVVKEQAAKYNLPPFDDLNLWRVDATYVYDTKYTFLKLYLLLKK